MRADRRFGRVLALGTLAAVLGGCGVEPMTHPVKVGDGVDVSAETQVGAVQPPAADEAKGPRQLLDYFFAAAVGGDKVAAGRVRSYLTKNGKWNQGESSNPTVVHILQVDQGIGSNNQIPYTVTYRPMGELTEKGTIVPPESMQTRTFLFLAERQESANWLLLGAPDGLLLSDEALTRYYRTRPIYFWDKAGQSLVPDLRYLPNTVPPEQRASLVMDWLVAGPSAQISGVVSGLPPGVEATGRIYANDAGVSVVNLSAKAATMPPEDLRALTDQLRWSMYGLGGSDNAVELQIEGQRKDVDGVSLEYVKRNLASVVQANTSRFGVVGGRLQALNPSDAGPVPPLTAAQNSGVRSGAVSSDGELAAVIRVDRSNKRTLVIAGKVVRPPPVDLSRFETVGRPVWVPVLPNSRQLLLLADGALRAYSETGKSIAVSAPNLPGAITAFSVSPEGRRIALISDGRAFLAGLAATANGTVIKGQLLQLGAGLLRPAAVAWSGEDQLLLAGTAVGGTGPALWRVSPDGAIATEVKVSGQNAITDMVAFPRDPITQSVNLRVMVVVSGGQAADFLGGTDGTLKELPQVSSPCYPS